MKNLYKKHASVDKGHERRFIKGKFNNKSKII